MENTLDLLLEQLSRIEEKTGGNRQLVEQSIASFFLFLAFGRDWYERKIAFRDDHPDPWMMNGSDRWLKRIPSATAPMSPRWWRNETGGLWLKTAKTNDVRRIVYTHRVIRLANALWTILLGEAKGVAEGFDVLRERLRRLNTESSFVEAEIASLLVFNDFGVRIMKETGVRGADFDFSVTRGGTTISVEVTSKRRGALTAQTIKNTLDSKRNQVPADRPAVLYMHVPREWMRGRRAFNLFSRTISDFFLHSRRFNAIVLVSEDVIPFLDGGFPATVMQACYNNIARHPFTWMELFTPLRRDGKTRCSQSLLEKLESYRAKDPQRQSTLSVHIVS
jgi:hypothetical protein